MRTREIAREYLALVEQRRMRSGTIDAPLGRDRGNRTLMSTRGPGAAVALRGAGAPARTLLVVRLETGRTHQIRAPRRDRPSRLRRPPVPGRRMRAAGSASARFLHAMKLMFRHPFTGKSRSASPNHPSICGTHYKQLDGSQSPEGQTGLKIESRRSRTASFRSLDTPGGGFGPLGGYPPRRSSNRPRRTMRSRPCPEPPGSADRPAGKHAQPTQGVSLPPRSASGAAGGRVHFGHQTRRWNPKMRRFIFGSAPASTSSTCRRPSGCCTPPRSSWASSPAAAAPCCSWGPRSRRATRSRRPPPPAACPTSTSAGSGACSRTSRPSQADQALARPARLDRDGTMDLLPVRERIGAMAERDKLETNLGGVADMQRPPDAMFVVDRRPRRSACARPRGSRSRSSGWSTPTATRSGDLRDPRATTTRSAPASS